jgi:hypothetical protein
LKDHGRSPPPFRHQSRKWLGPYATSTHIRYHKYFLKQGEILKIYAKKVPAEKLVLGIPAGNYPILLADEKNTGLKSKLNKYGPRSGLFGDIKGVSEMHYMIIQIFCFHRTDV